MVLHGDATGKTVAPSSHVHETSHYQYSRGLLVGTGTVPVAMIKSTSLWDAFMQLVYPQIARRSLCWLPKRCDNPNRRCGNSAHSPSLA